MAQSTAVGMKDVRIRNVRIITFLTQFKHKKPKLLGTDVAFELKKRKNNLTNCLQYQWPVCRTQKNAINTLGHTMPRSLIVPGVLAGLSFVLFVVHWVLRARYTVNKYFHSICKRSSTS